MAQAEHLRAVHGTRAVCQALSVPRASLYRALRRQAAPPAQRPVCRRALTSAEREQVLALLHSPRFADASPAEVYATLLDEQRYLCSERTMYRLLESRSEVRERRDQLAIRPTTSRSCWPPPRTRSGAGTSPSCSGPPSGPTSTCTSSSTSTAATSSAGWSPTARGRRWPNA